MGCTSSVQMVDSVDSGQANALDGSLDMASSFETWGTWRVSGPAPPSRRSHERHLRKLNAFRCKVEERPSTLADAVIQKRNCIDRGHRTEDVMVIVEF